jgi:short-subunit dehydrogenase
MEWKMDLQLAGKRVVITGGSKGIGRAAAETLAAEGCELLLVARDPSALNEAAEEIRGRFQVAVSTFAIDLSNDAAARAARRGPGTSTF